MIFTERVFGRLSPKRMSFGFAMAPILADPISQLLGDQLACCALGSSLL